MADLFHGLSMSDLFHMRQTHTLFRFRDFTLLSHAAKALCVRVCVCARVLVERDNLKLRVKTRPEYFQEV